MANLEDIQRARLGKEAWNEWAEENPGARVDFSGKDPKQIDFAGFVFPGVADFTNSPLDEQTSFKDAKSCDIAIFDNVRFLDSADLRGATFKGEANFHGVEISQGDAHFDGAKFEGHANFLGANFRQGAADFNGATFLEDAIFAESKFRRGAIFSGARFEKLAEFRTANFFGDAIFHTTTFIDGPALFNNVTFHQIANFGNARFGKKGTDFSSTNFNGHVTFGETAFAGYANFQRAKFIGEAAFRSTKFRGLAVFNDAQFTTIAIFTDSTFESVPTFHGAQLHQNTTFEAVTWPERPHESQSPYDAARAWAWLRVEMNRLHKHEDELLFFTRELNSRAYDTRNEPLTKRLLYRLYLVLGSGRSVAVPLSWLLGLNAFLFLPIYWFATSVIQGRKLWSWDVPADVISFTLGHALPFIGGSNPERPDLYRRLFAPADCSGIDVPLWLESVGVIQELTGVVLVFLVGLALRNRFRMK